MFGWFKKDKPKVSDLDYFPHASRYESRDDLNVLILDVSVSPMPVPPPVVRDIPRKPPKPRVYTEDEIAARALARQRDRDCMNANRR
jgi:hypothetical protein